MPSRLTEDEVARYARDGLLTPLDAIPAGEVARHLAAIEEIEGQRGGRLAPILNAKAHLLLPFLWDLVQDPRIVDPVADLLGPDILCWGTSFFSKAPGSRDFVSWHQDTTYWGLTEPKALTAWLAFTPSGPQNGCMRAVPGTHLRRVPHRNTADPHNMLPIGEEVAMDVDERYAVDCVLKPGQISIHHGLLVHGSAANTGGLRRVGFAIRYIAADVTQKNGMRNFATHVRGRDHGTFDLEQRPAASFDPDALLRHRRVMRAAIRVVDTASAEANRLP